jgi:hypothetical protein
VLARLKSSYYLPILLTEVGAHPTLTEAQAESYITTTVAELIAAKATYNVIGFNWYELYDGNTGGDGNYGLLSTASTKKGRYAAMKSAVASHPMQ